MLMLLESNSIEPITLTEVKAHLRLDTEAEDDLLNGLIASASNLVEEYLGKTLIKKVWQLQRTGVDVNGMREIEIPNGPLLNVVCIEQMLPNDTRRNIRFSVNNCFGKPIVTFKSQLPVLVTFEAGYGFYPKDVPAPIRQALLTLVAHFYDSRGGQMVMSPLVKTLLSPYKQVGLCV